MIAEHLKEYKNISFKIIGYGYQKKELGESIEAKQLPNMQLIEPKNREDTLAEIVDADIAYVSLVEKMYLKGSPKESNGLYEYEKTDCCRCCWLCKRGY